MKIPPQVEFFCFKKNNMHSLISYEDLLQERVREIVIQILLFCVFT